MRQTIGVAGNEVIEHVDYFHGNDVCYTQLNFITAIHEVGALPLVIPVSTVDTAKEYLSKVDKLLLTGGDDVSPLYYGEQPLQKLGRVNPHRDKFEIALIQEAIKQGKEILGICRGMQLINVALGGTLYQDLSENPDFTIKHMQAPTTQRFVTHGVAIEPESWLSKFLPEHHLINSYHHQAIKKLGENLKPVAYSHDGLIEAIESLDKKILGVQWHPEMNWRYEKTELNIFKYFVEKRWNEEEIW